MIPILYDRTETSFTSFGLGFLQECTACTVTEERNSTYEMVLTYPAGGKLFSRLGMKQCVKVTSNQGTQIFRIYATSKSLDGTTTYRARHISYDLCGYVVPNMVLLYGTPAVLISKALTDTLSKPLPFTVESDIDIEIPTATLNFALKVPFSVRELAGAVQDVTGGELEWDNLTVKLHARRGTDKGFTIRYGQNMTSFQLDEGETNGYTAIFPYAISSNGPVVLDSYTVPLPQAHDLSVPNVLIVDMTDRMPTDTDITKETLREASNDYIATYGEELARDSSSLTVECVRPGVNVRVCDTVRVIHEPLGVDMRAKVIKTEYDVLRDRLTGITVGDPKITLYSYIDGGITT